MLLRDASPAVAPVHAHTLASATTDLATETYINSISEQLTHDAELARIDKRSFETQVRLHLPSARTKQSSYHSAYDAIRPIVLIRAGQIRQELDQAELLANSSLLLPKTYSVKRNLELRAADGSRLALEFRSVSSYVGHVYQSRLHYLRCTRGDTRLHFGMFLPGARYPLTYVAVSPCDRPYMTDGLAKAHLDSNIEECMVLTRMYGLPGIPANLISLTLRHVIRALRQISEVRFLITAYNPLLGFTGAGFRASGFHPFALAPVSYWYNARGEFTTRRYTKDRPELQGACPPNVLMVRGIDKRAQKDIIGHIAMTQITEDNYKQGARRAGSLPGVDSQSWTTLLLGYRKMLEGAWSTETIHPSYLGITTSRTDPKGQCGVSSVWLARQLHSDFGVEATYCYGDLDFIDKGRSPVLHHCWIEIGGQSDPSRTVIDLTCDQADSVEEPVLSARHDTLLGRGMNYVARTRLSIDELPQDRVWPRFTVLDDAIKGPALEHR